MGGMARVNVAVVLVKGHIQNPVVGVFDGPVTAYCLQLPPGLGQETGNKARVSVVTQSPQRRSASTQTRLASRTTRGRGR